MDNYCKEHPFVKYEYLPPKDSCLIEPPVKDLPVVSTDDASCPSQFSLCLDVDAGLTLEHNIKAQRRWAKEAWIRCSATDVGVPDGGL